MIIHITKVKVVGSHSLDLTFDNDVRKRVNLRQELVWSYLVDGKTDADP